MQIRVGVAGFRGYSGAELIHLLAHHPSVEVVLLDHRDGQNDGPEYLGTRAPERISPTADAVRQADLSIVLLATPPEVSMDLAGEILAGGVRVIDLSGAFRLKTDENYRRWYHAEHTEPELLAEAIYGLPEFHRDKIPGARLVANPGCYPTAANLAIRPLIQSRLIDAKLGLICDAKSGVSGAGRKAALRTSFCEVAGNFSAYAILEHRHVPEILFHTGLEESDFSFTAQLIPIERGILETIYFRALPGVTEQAIRKTYATAYENEPFVRIHEARSTPELHQVAHTNFCDIGITVDEKSGRGVLVSAIDNLGKGAAGQAIQNMNLLLGLPETEGLL
jgi:N-acetyl-gamma-glutamyl-phosphate reductase